MKLFTIYDTVSETYETPITLRTTAEMERALEILFKQTPDHKFVQYPDGYSLYEIGDFDEHTGETAIYPEKRQVSNLIKYKQ